MRVEITEGVIPAAEIVAGIKAGPDGAVCVFDGIVRDNTRGRETLYLDYEAYREMALEQMRALAAEAVVKFAVRDVTLVHRLGRLEVGETSVLVVVASAHRGAAFDACRWLIDTLKKTVPIWKKEYFVAGAVWAAGEAFPSGVGVRGASEAGAPSVGGSGTEGGAHISESRYGAPGGLAGKLEGRGEEGGRASHDNPPFAKGAKDGPPDSVSGSGPDSGAVSGSGPGAVSGAASSGSASSASASVSGSEVGSVGVRKAEAGE
jgi:molybdopterin synthase catalytic subunit